MKQLIIVTMLLALLIGCGPITPYPSQQKETPPQVVPPTTEVVKAEIPEENIIDFPVVEEKTQPVPEPTAPIAPGEPIIEESTLSPKEKCMASCESQCESDAAIACRQDERSACRANCGDIITTSACTQVCTYVLQQKGQCKSQFEKFCKTQCVSKC